MRVSYDNATADNLIKLVKCLKTIKTDEAKIGIYAEKMFDKDNNPIEF